MKKIVYSLDYLRVIACIMVIGIHNMHLVSENVQDVRYIAINHFVKLGLPLFFVLSSIALENSVEYINDLKKYYSKKVLSLGIYFFIFSIFYYEYTNDKLSSLSTAIKSIPRGFLETFTTNQFYHMWYMYSLIGLVLWLPFLKVLLKNLTFRQHLCLSLILFTCSALKIYAKVLIGECHWISWGIYYILGALTLRDEYKKYYSPTIIIGLIAFISSIIIDIKMPDSVLMNNKFEYGPLAILQVMGIFVLFLKFNDRIQKFNEGVNKFVHKVSSLTYLIYLSHPAVILYTSSLFWKFKGTLCMNNGILFFLFLVFGVFILSAFVSLLFKLCENGLKYLWNRKNDIFSLKHV